MRFMAGVTILALAALSPLAAQAPAPSGARASAISEGDTLRLWVERAQWVRGVYTGRVGDTLRVLVDQTLMEVPVARVRSAQVQRGLRRSPGGMLVLGILGAGAGLVIGGALGMSLECGGSCGANDGEMGGFGGAVSGGAMGLLLGGIAGAALGGRREPRWVNTSLQSP